MCFDGDSVEFEVYMHFIACEVFLLRDRTKGGDGVASIFEVFHSDIKVDVAAHSAFGKAVVVG